MFFSAYIYTQIYLELKCQTVSHIQILHELSLKYQNASSKVSDFCIAKHVMLQLQYDYTM